ncbi:MAG: dihydrolipoamide acetyltransferase family protein [Terracidiphilus sp.]|jgi:2-oxoglutarate dehydrogenase E2 component (dihydrolipoamide succinyltransferase)
MPTDVIMPQMGESIFEGTITKWLKKAGDRVEKDEPLFEISTDKVDAEIPSPEAGVLTEIKIAQGVTVEVNTVVAVIDDAASVAPPEPSLENLPAVQDAGSQETNSGRQVKGTGISTYMSSEVSAGALAPEGHLSTNAPAIDSSASPAPLAPGQQLRSSPLVRRIAKENNLDLRLISGTGSQGRITKEDILRHLAERGPGTSAPQAQLAPQLLTKMRAIIAQRMMESKQISAHAHTVYKVDMTRVVRLRQREKTRFEQQHGVKLTYMPFIAAAAAQALRNFPILNASLKDGFIHYHPNVNLGIAVSLEWGLIVPVVRQAETESFLSLARAIADLAARARSKKLLPDEIQGGTFTLTNSGVYGGEFGTPIINQPESAILAIGGLRKEPVVVTDADGNDSIAIRSVQYFCLGFDHRLIDGADSGKFMVEFKRTLEEWDSEIG